MLHKKYITQCDMLFTFKKMYLFDKEYFSEDMKLRGDYFIPKGAEIIFTKVLRTTYGIYERQNYTYIGTISFEDKTLEIECDINKFYKDNIFTLEEVK